jgi:hypothetical protein
LQSLDNHLACFACKAYSFVRFKVAESWIAAAVGNLDNLRKQLVMQLVIGLFAIIVMGTITITIDTADKLMPMASIAAAVIATVDSTFAELAKVVHIKAIEVIEVTEVTAVF